MLQGRTHLVNFFSILQFSGHTLCTHFLKFKMIMHYSVCKTIGIPQYSCYTVYCHPLVSSNQLPHPLHYCFCYISTGRPGQSSPAAYEWPWENFLTQLLTALCNKHFPQETGNISLWISFALSPFAHKKKAHNRIMLFSNTLLKHCHHFDYWNQPLNMHIYYLDCHEGGLCCYLLLHVENLIHPLQVFYFHLWLSLISYDVIIN
jgi:hypothetical protein